MQYETLEQRQFRSTKGRASAFQPEDKPAVLQESAGARVRLSRRLRRRRLLSPRSPVRSLRAPTSDKPESSARKQSTRQRLTNRSKCHPAAHEIRVGIRPTQKKEPRREAAFFRLSAPCRNRTYNLMIKSHLLCQLS